MGFFKNWFLFLALFFFVGNDVLPAQNANPFEIKSRLDSVAKLPKSIVFDTLIAPQTGIKDSIVPSTIDSSNIKVVNPFDVDHIPLRKTKTSSSSEFLGANKNQIVSEKPNNNFIFWVLLLVAALLAIVINVNITTLRLIFRSVFNLNLFKLFHREEGTHLSLTQGFLYLIFIVNVTLALFLWIKIDSPVLSIIDWLNLFYLLTAVYFVKHILIFVLGNIFNIQKSTSLYNFSIFSYHALAGILLMPLNLIAAFSPNYIAIPIIYLSLIIICFIVIFKVLRGLIISLDFWSNRFLQFFIYLCAFEILPVMILVKFLLYQGNL
ncbi:MAG: DUF4271 domain-containing protein [Saprospiraceae bacterium]